ncbi:aminotransferase class I/II-fold pyridoxal phosphate-dependent enzyme [Streptomyces sp. NBC_01260]|uniref:aminotransferase class I/II-fold pyridoxal phosphate-dependent enzyme n=1 Tax=unclassified Streptomyces TaxID=2593676 RepID=UPI00224D1033|nr:MULTISPECIES: aminotransferase class I/II-fold pyridoxal phosphate-dependent enzyme [unclassified Streptomyces]MCX4771946.1 aminotransferase class I/II-fold pyridoxal phosphate-dependent enzyme [Streptomyces sp. NBC_01285]
MNGSGASSAASSALTLADYAAQASERMSPGVWDFIDGGAGQERTLAANVEAFNRVRLNTRVLSGVAYPDTGTRILGRAWAAPLAIAPVAYHTLADPEGEVATARAAGETGVPLVVSTFAGRTFEDIASAASCPLWLQVYCFRDRDTTRQLIERAERAGFEALVLTVDAPHLGRRLRDLRNDFRLPPGIEPANLTGTGFDSPSGHARSEFDATLDWSVIEWLRSFSSLPVLVKGILTASDAQQAIASGAQGIVVSNHGGRQLDGAPATLDVLPEIAEEVAGACPVLLDGGIRHGADVLAGLALGADAVLLGRPVLHGLAVGQEEGVRRVLSILTEELREAMTLTGTSAVTAVRPDLVRSAAAVARPNVPARVGTALGRLPSNGSSLLKEDLHGSLGDPVLDTMNFLNEITHRYPDAVSFAPGRPYDGFFETEQIFEYLRRYMEHLVAGGASPDQVRSALFQYGPTSGQIRDVLADWLRKDEDIDVPPESIVVTVGCQEAMLLAVRALISGPEDVLLVSSPCYVGITGAARLLDAELTAVAEHIDGFRCADLEAAIRAERAQGRRPRAFYVIPDHANPSGTTIPLKTRHELLELAAREDILLLEDSPYRLVSEGNQLPSLKSLDRDRRVVHLGSLSKTLFPGARVGFVVADQTVVDSTGGTGLLAEELTKIKSMVTVNTSPVAQAMVAGMLLAADGRASEFNSKTAQYYGDAMRVTLQQLEETFPKDEREALGIRWNEPSGGFFLAVSVPFRADNAALERSAEEFGVIWTPMSYFYPQGGGEHGLRLSVSYLSHAEIADGIGRLARFIKAQSAAPRPTT